jgi:hypothetical protein
MRSIRDKPAFMKPQYTQTKIRGIQNSTSWLENQNVGKVRPLIILEKKSGYKK